jgi:tetratricopeptide (TPR) repeat protein
MGNRPGMGNRPNRPNFGGRPNRPNFGDRPNRPNFGDRTNIGNLGGRTNIGDRTNIGGGNTIGSGNTRNTVINAPTNINYQQASVNAGRTGRYGGNRDYGARARHTPYRSYYDGWHHGNWGWYGGQAAATGAGLGWLAGTSSGSAYSNPYYTAPAQEAPAALNYAQPIAIQAPPEEVETPADDNSTVAEEEATPTLTPPARPKPAEETPNEDPVVRQAMALLEEARIWFPEGRFDRAQYVIEKAIKLVPGDATLHEFRALILFARKKYPEAAGTLYAVLAAGPGWDWQTLKSFYDSDRIYQQQLRALEKHSRDHPGAADDHFLLAYHYLVLDAKDAAVKHLEKVVQLVPKDELSAALLKALKPPPQADDRPQPEE